MVMDLRGVVTGDGAIAEQPGQHFGADLGQFIEEQVRASVLGVDGEQAGSSRWLQHHVAGSDGGGDRRDDRSEEHTSELQSLMRISYAVFCLKKKKIHKAEYRHNNQTEHNNIS